MWLRSTARSNGDGGRWLVGLFNIGDPLTTAPIPGELYTLQGIQGWTDINVGCPGEGCKVGVIPDGWAWGWMSGDKEVLEVHPDAQNITISCSQSGCPERFGVSGGGSIVLTATATRD